MTDPAVRIGLFHPYPERLGGSQQVALALAPRLPSFGFQPVVLVPGEGSFVDAARGAGIETIVCEPGPRWRVIGTEARSADWMKPAVVHQLWRYWHALRDVVRRAGVSLVHCFDVRGALMAAPAARMAHRPAIWHVHSSPRGVGMRIAGPAIAASARNLLYVSQGAADAWRLPHGILGLTDVVPNGLDLSTVSGRGTPQEPATLLVAGSLSPIKGQDVLIRAMPAILRQFPDARCLLAGHDWADGQFLRRLRELVARSGLEDSVAFLGHRSDIPQLIERSACVVVPSRMETFGMIAVEAMALSRPVIASKIGGLPEVVEDGETGVLVPPDEPDALAHAVITLLSDRERAQRMGGLGDKRWTRSLTA